MIRCLPAIFTCIRIIPRTVRAVSRRSFCRPRQRDLTQSPSPTTTAWTGQKKGHLLVLGVTEVIPAGLDVVTTVNIARRMGALAILPHPYHVWRHGVARRKKVGMNVVDAVEAFNSRYIVGSANQKAARIAKRLGKPCVGGSDAHNAKFVGFGRTYVEAEKNVPAILEAIRVYPVAPA